MKSRRDQQGAFIDDGLHYKPLSGRMYQGASLNQQRTTPVNAFMAQPSKK